MRKVHWPVVLPLVLLLIGCLFPAASYAAEEPPVSREEIWQSLIVRRTPALYTYEDMESL